jgi:hypothetical protein
MMSEPQSVPTDVIARCARRMQELLVDVPGEDRYKIIAQEMIGDRWKVIFSPLKERRYLYEFTGKRDTSKITVSVYVKAYSRRDEL